MSQLALPLSLQDRGVFESFWAGENEALVAHLRGLAETAQGSGAGRGCWLWGAGATGKTHLLHAVCNFMEGDAVYLPLRQFAGNHEILEGLASRRCVCIDDIDVIAGDEAFEVALFALLNELADREGLLVVSAGATPRESGFGLADLQSRLSRLPIFRIEPLDEAGRIAALKLRASHRGLELPGDTARFLLNRSRRDMASLYRLLDRLDTEALIAQRRLTIPFVRQIIEAPDTAGER